MRSFYSKTKVQKNIFENLLAKFRKGFSILIIELSRRKVRTRQISVVISILLIMNPFLRASAQHRNISVVVDYFHVGNHDQFSVGTMLQVPVGERFSLNYQVAVGYKPGGGVYVHSHAGGYASVYTIARTVEHPNIRSIGILLVLIPEGLGFYPDENKKYHISLNPLGVDYWHHKEPFEEISKLTGTVTIHRKFFTTAKFPSYIAPYIAASMIYKSDENFDKYGFRCGILLGMKDNPE